MRQNIVELLDGDGLSDPAFSAMDYLQSVAIDVGTSDCIDAEWFLDKLSRFFHDEKRSEESPRPAPGDFEHEFGTDATIAIRLWPAVPALVLVDQATRDLVGPYRTIAELAWRQFIEFHEAVSPPRKQQAAWLKRWTAEAKKLAKKVGVAPEDLDDETQKALLKLCSRDMAEAATHFVPSLDPAQARNYMLGMIEHLLREYCRKDVSRLRIKETRQVGAENQEGFSAYVPGGSRSTARRAKRKQGEAKADDRCEFGDGMNYTQVGRLLNRPPRTIAKFAAEVARKSDRPIPRHNGRPALTSWWFKRVSQLSDTRQRRRNDCMTPKALAEELGVARNVVLRLIRNYNNDFSHTDAVEMTRRVYQITPEQADWIESQLAGRDSGGAASGCTR